MDQPHPLHPRLAEPASATPAMWAAVGHYLAHHRGTAVPLAALLRCPWRCLLGLAGSARLAATGEEGAVVLSFPGRAVSDRPAADQRD